MTLIGTTLELVSRNLTNSDPHFALFLFCFVVPIVHLFIFFFFFFSFVASMVRKIYLRGGLGVGAFRRIYGGSKRNGSRPPHFCKSSGSVARHILQQLEALNIIEVDPKG